MCRAFILLHILHAIAHSLIESLYVSAGQALKDRLAYEKKKKRKQKIAVYRDVKKLLLNGKIHEAQKEAEHLSAGEVSSFSYLADISLLVSPLVPALKKQKKSRKASSNANANANANVELLKEYANYKRDLDMSRGITYTEFSVQAPLPTAR